MLSAFPLSQLCLHGEKKLLLLTNDVYDRVTTKTTNQLCTSCPSLRRSTLRKTLPRWKVASNIILCIRCLLVITADLTTTTITESDVDVPKAVGEPITGDSQFPVKLELKDLDLTPTYLHGGNKGGDSDDLIHVRYYMRLRLANASGGMCYCMPCFEKVLGSIEANYWAVQSSMTPPPTPLPFYFRFRTLLEHEWSFLLQESFDWNDSNRRVRRHVKEILRWRH